jgi:hypothetical protein
VNAEEKQWKWLRRRRRNGNRRQNIEGQRISKISKITAIVDEFFLCMHNSEKMWRSLESQMLEIHVLNEIFF